MDTATEYDFSTIEVSESEPMPEPDALTCKVCGTSITYGGRGPKPKYCSEHKRSTSAKSPRAKKKSGTDYTEGIAGLLQLPAAALGIAGSQGKKPKYELLADAAVITYYTPGIATAVNDLAQDRPEVAAVLDKILKVGPYGALLAAVMPMTLQILANHKILPAGHMGTQTVEQVLGIPTESREGDPDAR
jgi:hypothetical protein